MTSLKEDDIIREVHTNQLNSYEFKNLKKLSLGICCPTLAVITETGGKLYKEFEKENNVYQQLEGFLYCKLFKRDSNLVVFHYNILDNDTLNKWKRYIRNWRRENPDLWLKQLQSKFSSSPTSRLCSQPQTVEQFIQWATETDPYFYDGT